jgi:hypothetical protein
MHGEEGGANANTVVVADPTRRSNKEYNELCIVIKKLDIAGMNRNLKSVKSHSRVKCVQLDFIGSRTQKHPRVFTLLFSEKKSSSRHLSTWGYVAENRNRNIRQRAAGAEAVATPYDDKIRPVFSTRCSGNFICDICLASMGGSGGIRIFTTVLLSFIDIVGVVVVIVVIFSEDSAFS